MTLWNNRLRRSPVGQKRRIAVQHEAQQVKTLEGTKDRLGLFQLHHVDFLHTGTPWRDTGTLKAGQPDYFLMGDGPNGPWSAFLEIKARNLETGKLGRMQANQYAYHDKLRERGHEVWTAWLPDDLQAINLWLRAKTGIVVEIEL